MLCLRVSGQAAVLSAVVVGLLAASIGVLAWQHFAARYDRAALALLRSDDTKARRDGAWLAAAEAAPRAIGLIARLLPRETDPDVRESYVYALGRSGQPHCFDLIADVARCDPNPYVRQTAWVAAARLDAARFRQLAATTAPGADPWDAIGLAHAGLEVGDVRGLPDLLRWAVNGTRDQRHIASLALYRHVAPLLDAAGRWPIEWPLTEGAPWPPELAAEVARRLAELDLQRIAADAGQHAERMAGVRRSAGKLLKARERLAWFLSRF